MLRPSALLPGRRGIHLTRDERKQELNNDPCVKAFNANHAVCALCECVITLRGRFYMDVWDFHHKNCLERRVAYLDKNGLEIRNTMLSADPLVRKYDATRVLCRTCNQWISILTSVDQWTQHQNACMDLNMSSEDQVQLHWGTPSWQRRTAEERKNILVADRLIEKVEPYRVRCRLCQRWICLRNNCQYVLLPWRQHRKVKQ
ncbi:hypothetical protein EDD85DRAFT_782909 [Armillaria nabsnona]|nr:hypothetical protein EDD85DRAFT_782909 [Armillaria nabsnona]